MVFSRSHWRRLAGRCYFTTPSEKFTLEGMWTCFCRSQLSSFIINGRHKQCPRTNPTRLEPQSAFIRRGVPKLRPIRPSVKSQTLRRKLPRFPPPRIMPRITHHSIPKYVNGTKLSYKAIICELTEALYRMNPPGCAEHCAKTTQQLPRHIVVIVVVVVIVDEL